MQRKRKEDVNQVMEDNHASMVVELEKREEREESVCVIAQRQNLVGKTVN